MEQASFKTNTLVLKVKSYLAIKVLFCFMAVAMFIGPLTGQIIKLANGKDLHIKTFFILAFTYAVAYFVLKYALWNTWGKEIYEFRSNQIFYTADYKFFKHRKSIEYVENLSFNYEPVGYEEDNKGRLSIQFDDQSFHSVVTISIPQLKKLISDLEARASHGWT